ncbi:MAG: hypothetical protein KGL18_17475 [Burkholderiales bacterium]|nr:hypothetical protein [Burkholderiales bacterium]MDE1926101.1 hypothetical protein [Burkholderiales bacterium]MDE2158739.1 hypothetical protein [Burkholderiales bacterium]MDE2504758.1 hypothetical protein [Burkholderiales bacterium]
MSYLALLWARIAGRRSLPPRPAPTVPEPNPHDDVPAGCGWFESSHDLRHGLTICETGAIPGLPA